MSADGRITDPDEIQRILRERADALAQPPESEEDPADSQALVVLAIADERYGIPLACVREIKPLGAVTPLAGTPPYWLGLVNLRGALFPVLDLQRYLGTGVGRRDQTESSQVVIVAGAGITIGLHVDHVLEVRTVRTADIGPSLVEAATDRPHAYAGLTRDLVAVLDVEALLADPALVVQDAID